MLSNEDNMGLEKSISVKEAIEILSINGHGILTVDAAKQICISIEVPFDQKLIIRWKSQEDAFKRFGFFANLQGPDIGVDCLRLLYYITDKLGSGHPGSKFIGRGYQADENIRVITHFLRTNGKL